MGTWAVRGAVALQMARQRPKTGGSPTLSAQPVIRHRRSSKTCPDCQQPLVRVRRWPSEQAAVDNGSGVPMRRYRCVTLGCGWQGLLPRPPASLPAPPPPTPRTLPLRARVPWAQAGGAVLAAALLVLVTVQGTRHVLNASPDLAPSVARSWSAGEQHDGDPLPARHPWLRPVVATAADTLPAVAASAPAAQPAASVDALTLRRGCVWGQPGRNPYRGTVEQALLHARLPAEVVTEIARKVKAHEISDRLEIRTGRIHGVQGGREFDPEHLVLSFGNTLCLNSRVNFAPGHSEPADLYEAVDKRGRRHAVMVPDVCGNVSVLGERGERRRAFGLLAGADTPDDEWRLLATGAAPADSAEVPEPGTLAAALAALAALGVVRMRQRALARPRGRG